MLISRRDFIHAGCVAGCVSLSPSIMQKAHAGLGLHGSGTVTVSQRNIVNVNFTFVNDYPLIVANGFNKCYPQLNGAGPFDGFTLSPYPQLIDGDGYPNTVAGSSSGNLIGSFNIPSPLNFTGPWVITWDGDGSIGVTGSGLTWTEANNFTPGTCTITIGNPTISFTNSFTAGQRVQFTTTGALPTGIVASNLYYVLASGLSGSGFQISAAPGGAAITPTGSQSGTQTVSGTYSRLGNGFYGNIAGQKAYVVANYSGTSPDPQQILYSIASTASPATISSISWTGGLVTVTMAAAHKRPIGTSLKLTILGSSNSAVNGTFFSTITSSTQFTFPLAGSGTVASPGTMCAFVSNIQIYRQADETDLLAGNIFRAAWKQPIVNLNPSAVRFMNWNGGNSGQAYSFLNRNTPNLANWGPQGSQAFNFTAGPAYGRTSGNQAYTLAAVTTGTVSNPNTTPASMTHGEVVQCQIGSGGTLALGGSVSVSNITKATNGQVTTATPHGFTTGAVVIHQVPQGMVLLDLFPVTVTVIDSLNYTINVNTSAYPTFVATGANAQAYTTLNVGARGAFPVIFPFGTPASVFGTSQITAGNYKTFIFDKNLIGQSDGAGNYIKGAWVFGGNGTYGFSNDVPLEICVAAVNELNAMSVAQGKNNPIHMYATSTPYSMTSIDPDSNSGNIWGSNMLNVILNGANGYAGLTAKAKLLIEYSNEIWNSSGSAIALVMNWRGVSRWPSLPFSQTAFYDAGMLWGTAFQRDVGANSRVWRVQGGTINEGSSVGSDLYIRAFGNASSGQVGNLYTTDSVVVSGGWGAPISNVEMFNFAPYLSPVANYWTGGGFASDSSLYAGGGAGQTTAINNFITQVVNSGGGFGSGLTIADYLTFTTAVNAWIPGGKNLINYEGGPDWPTSAGATYNGHTLTSADSNFLLAVQNSTQLGTMLTNFFGSMAGNSKFALPSVYTMITGSTVAAQDERWGYSEPDAYPLPPGSGSEGQGLANNGAWAAMTTRNATLAP